MIILSCSFIELILVVIEPFICTTCCFGQTTILRAECLKYDTCTLLITVNITLLVFCVDKFVCIYTRLV